MKSVFLLSAKRSRGTEKKTKTKKIEGFSLLVCLFSYKVSCTLNDFIYLKGFFTH